MTRQVFEVEYYLQAPAREWMLPKVSSRWTQKDLDAMPDMRDKHGDMIEAESEEALRQELAARYEPIFDQWSKTDGPRKRYRLEILSVKARPEIRLYDPSNLSKLKKEGWEHAGTVDVDAGLVMVGDPCYVSAKADREDTPDLEHVVHNWSKFCDLIQDDGPTIKQLNHPPGHSGAGVVVSSGIGDGSYPVYVRKAVIPGWGLRVVELRVLFDYTAESEEVEE